MRQQRVVTARELLDLVARTRDKALQDGHELESLYVRADLDGCLLDNRLRMGKTLQKFLIHPCRGSPEKIARQLRRADDLSNEPGSLAYEARDAWKQIAEDAEDLERTEEWFRFFKREFFTADMTSYDLPFQGAVALTERLVERGLHFSVLSSRPEGSSAADRREDLRPATERYLRLHGFPEAVVYLKSIALQISEAEFKRTHFENHGPWSRSIPLVCLEDKGSALHAFAQSMRDHHIPYALPVFVRTIGRKHDAELPEHAVILESFEMPPSGPSRVH